MRAGTGSIFRRLLPPVRLLPALCRGLVLVAAFSLYAPLHAQSGAAASGRGEVFVGSEIEDYLRVLQVGGRSALYPWSIRSFSPREVERLLPQDSLHPWAGRYDLAPDARGALRFDLIPPRARVIFNSAFPYGPNEGPVWAGRGLTTAVQAGLSVRLGPLSATLAPVAFRAENMDFPLAPNGYDGRLAFADAQDPTVIDLPQRFGAEPYMRLDPGQSTLRLDLPLLAAGISTANQHWGPALDHPILLGNNAPGYLHAFLGTSAPLNLWLGRVHGRMVWGRLEQSDYSTVDGPASRRFMSGIIGTITPRGIGGLELGAARFFHEPWPEEGLTGEDFLRPIEAFWKSSLPAVGPIPGDPQSAADNQLASVFFRWVLPRSAVEVYGEYGREDHSWDLRDFLLEPDHSGGYMFGLRKSWTRDERILSVRGELLNLMISNIARGRAQAPFYVHTWTVQGHTHRGQILGSAAGYGGAGAIVAADLYHPGGRWSLAWTREVRGARGDFSGAPMDDPRGLDVTHGLRAEGLFFRRRFDLTAGLTALYNLNRDFGRDAFNLNAVFGVRAGL